MEHFAAEPNGNVPLHLVKETRVRSVSTDFQTSIMTATIGTRSATAALAASDTTRPLCSPPARENERRWADAHSSYVAEMAGRMPVSRTGGTLPPANSPLTRPR